MTEQRAAGGRQIHLHPLILVNISDHYTRVVVEVSDEIVIGAMVGIQQGLDVSILDTFEVPYRSEHGHLKIDEDYLRLRSELFATVYPNYELLGWYSIGHGVHDQHLAIHQQFITSFNTSPIFLLLNPNPTGSEQADKNLPVSIFESEMHLVQETPTRIFVQAAFKVKTHEAERIAVDHMAKIIPDSGSAIHFHLENIKMSIETLSERMHTLERYLKDTMDGKTPMDHQLVRKIASICHQLPLTDSPTFNARFLQEYNDTLLVTYLSSITKGASSIAEILDKFGTAQEYRPKRRGGMM